MEQVYKEMPKVQTRSNMVESDSGLLEVYAGAVEGWVFHCVYNQSQ